MADYQFDVLVVGTGPGGEGAAMQAAKDGKNVAVVERHAHIGGGCTHWGTIPSKALRHAIFQFSEMLGNSLLRHWPQRQVTFTELRATAGTVIARQESLRRGFYERNQVPIFRGDACFVDAHTVQVADRTISAAAIVLATGARPYHPEGIDFQNPRIRDSDTILGLDETPKSITIYGAGVVGTEYASMFRNLNTKVNLVNTRQKLLEFLDDEIIDALSYHLRDCGIIIRHNEQYERIEARDDGVILHLQSGKKLKTDLLLWANGRTGNTDSLGLEKAGLRANQRGQLEVNQNFQTAVPHVYAVGDPIGYPSLASAAYTQGRAAATHIVTGVCEHDWMADIPTGIYTMPEISSVGKTERELTEKKIPYEVGQAQFKSLARAQITGRTVGMLKLLFHRETLQLLGIHCFGENASEIVHIGQAIMAQTGAGNSLLYFMNTTFNYPTMAEAYRVAALNGYNRLF